MLVLNGAPSRKSINKSVERRDLQEGLVVHGIDNKPKLNRSTNIDQEISVIAYGILRPRASKFVVSSKIHKTIGRGLFLLVTQSDQHTRNVAQTD